MILGSFDEIRNVGMLWGKYEEMLDTLDAFDTDAFAIFKRKLVNEIQD